MNHRFVSAIFLFVAFAVAISISYSQTITPSDSNALGVEFHRAMRISVDSAIQIQQKNVDSLARMLETKLHSHTLLLKTLTDSLMKSARESLDPPRIDSAYQLHKEFSNKLKVHGNTQRQALRNRLKEYEQAIIDMNNTHEACIDCTEPEDFAMELSAFHDNADSSSEVFFDSIVDHFDAASSNLSDSTETFCDSLAMFVETLIENRSAELDSIQEHSNKLTIWMNANSYASFHGRDGGISQAIVSPLIAFRHPYGIRLSLGISYLEQQSNHWDGTALGLAYEFTFSPVLGGSIGYTHYWFDSSSTQTQSVFNQSVDAELDISTSLADFSFAAGINFNDQSEYSFEFTATHCWQIGKRFIIAPIVRASWGEQNLTLIEKQLQKVQRRNPKTKKNVTRNVIVSTSNQSNIFSILDYEIAIPVSIRIGRLVLTPSVTAVFPFAVFDGSRDVPFFSAELTATIDLIW